MLYHVVASTLALGFAPTAPIQSGAARGALAVQMSEPGVARRAFLTTAGAALATAAPLAAFADCASSPAVLERSRAIYGSRVARLVDASPEAILEEKNCFTLFT